MRPGGVFVIFWLPLKYILQLLQPSSGIIISLIVRHDGGPLVEYYLPDVMVDCPICMKWPEIPGVEFGFSWDISTNNWLVGRDALKDPLHRTAIKATLTADQIKSLVILDEWWIFEESMDKERLNE